MVKRVSVILAVLALVWNGSIRAEDLRATASVDSNRVLIGDWLTLRIDVQHGSDKKVAWPSIPDSLEGFEIIHRNAPTLKNDGSNVLESAAFTLTAFDTGVHVIPPLVFHYTVAGDTMVQSAETAPIPVFVRGIPVDTAAEIKDIKPPLGVPISFMEMLPYIIGVLVAGGIIWLISYVIRKRKKGESLIPEAPPRPPQELALEALQALEGEQLWQRGRVKEYHTGVTDIVRLYIERKYRMLAMEMTTDEILGADELRGLDAGCLSILKKMLVLGDLVKFAKVQPAPAENESSLSLARAFVEQTSAVREEPARPATVEEVNA